MVSRALMFRWRRKHQRHILDSSTGSLFTPAAAGGFFADAKPVVAERSSRGECERNVVTTASRATTTKQEMNSRFIKTSVWLEIRVACTTGLRPTAAGGCDLPHDLVFSGVSRFFRVCAQASAHAVDGITVASTTLPAPRGIHAAAARSSLSAPRMTILSASSGKAAAMPWLHPTARASTRPALRRWSGSPAWPWDGSARPPRSAMS